MYRTLSHSLSSSSIQASRHSTSTPSCKELEVIVIIKFGKGKDIGTEKRRVKEWTPDVDIWPNFPMRLATDLYYTNVLTASSVLFSFALRLVEGDHMQVIDRGGYVEPDLAVIVLKNFWWTAHLLPVAGLEITFKCLEAYLECRRCDWSGW